MVSRCLFSFRMSSKTKTVTIKTSGTKRKAGSASIYSKKSRVASVAKRGTRVLNSAQVMVRGSNARTGGFMGIELKYKDSSLVAHALVSPTDAAGGEADPATLLALNAIAQGDSEQERDGKQVCVKSCFVTGLVNVPPLANQTAGGSIPWTYVALVLDKQTNGAQLNSEDVFTNPGASAVTAAAVLRDLQYTSRFQVLDSVVIEPKMIAASYDGTNIEAFGTVCPFKLSWSGELMTNYTSTTAVVANIQDTSLHIIAYTSPAVGSTLSYNARVRFVG